MPLAYPDEEIAQHKATICERISSGESLRSICENEGWWKP